MFATDHTTQQALKAFRKFDADTQLALLWHGYLDIKENLQPGEDNSVRVPAQALYNAIKAMSPEGQLQAQRDIVVCADNQIGQTYGALASSARLELWLMLAQGMEKGEIIGMPEDYQLPADTNDFVNQITSLGFEERINFTRSAVMEMGTAAK